MPGRGSAKKDAGSLLEEKTPIFSRACGAVKVTVLHLKRCRVATERGKFFARLRRGKGDGSAPKKMPGRYRKSQETSIFFARLRRGNGDGLPKETSIFSRACGAVKVTVAPKKMPGRYR